MKLEWSLSCFLLLTFSPLMTAGQTLVLTPPSDGEVFQVAGDNYIVNCQVSGGSPTENPTWYDPNGNDILGMDSFSPEGGLGGYGNIYTLDTDNNGTSLHFQPVLESNKGLYTCEYLDKRISFRLSILVPISFGDTKTNQTAVLGEENLIECKVSGMPQPEVVWKLPSGDEPGIGYVQEDNGLLISKTTNADKGIFVCQATVLSPENHEQIEITVDVVSPSAPIVNTELTKTPVYSWVGNPTKMTCIIEGNPVPIISWDRNGKDFDPTFQYTVETDGFSSYLLFTAQEADFGEYRCIGNNEYNGQQWSAEQAISLIKPVEPGAVTDLKVEETYSTTVRLSLKKPEDDGGVAVTEYKVRAFKENSDEERFFQTIGATELNNEDTFLARYFTPSMNYTIDVAAVNMIGPGAYSTVSVKMKDARAPYPLNITSGTLAGVVSYALEWEPIDDGGAEIMSYKIKIIRIVNDYYKVIEKTINGISKLPTDYTISGLDPETRYEIILYAVNSFGDGDETKTSVMTQKVQKVTSSAGHLSSALVVSKLLLFEWVIFSFLADRS